MKRVSFRATRSNFHFTKNNENARGEAKKCISRCQKTAPRVNDRLTEKSRNCFHSRVIDTQDRICFHDNFSAVTRPVTFLLSSGKRNLLLGFKAKAMIHFHPPCIITIFENLFIIIFRFTSALLFLVYRYYFLKNRIGDISSRNKS